MKRQQRRAAIHAAKKRGDTSIVVAVPDTAINAAQEEGSSKLTVARRPPGHWVRFYGPSMRHKILDYIAHETDADKLRAAGIDIATAKAELDTKTRKMVRGALDNRLRELKSNLIILPGGSKKTLDSGPRIVI